MNTKGSGRRAQLSELARGGRCAIVPRVGRDGTPAPTESTARQPTRFRTRRPPVHDPRRPDKEPTCAIVRLGARGSDPARRCCRKRPHPDGGSARRPRPVRPRRLRQLPPLEGRSDRATAIARVAACRSEARVQGLRAARRRGARSPRAATGIAGRSVRDSAWCSRERLSRSAGRTAYVHYARSCHEVKRAGAVAGISPARARTAC